MDDYKIKIAFKGFLWPQMEGSRPELHPERLPNPCGHRRPRLYRAESESCAGGAGKDLTAVILAPKVNTGHPNGRA